MLQPTSALLFRGKIRRILDISLFTASIVLSFWCLAAWLGFDGVAFYGLHANAGRIERGHEFTQVVTAFNFSPHSLKVVVLPTCGCALDQLSQYKIRPMSWCHIPIRYLIVDGKAGPKERDMLLVYEHFDVQRRVMGEIHFILS